MDILLPEMPVVPEGANRQSHDMPFHRRSLDPIVHAGVSYQRSWCRETFPARPSPGDPL